MIQIGDPGALLKAESLAESLDSREGTTGAILSGIVFFRIVDPVAIAVLGRMATSEEAPYVLRAAAARGLSSLHSESALPWLGLLVTDPSEELQFWGARGLSFYVNGVGVPSLQGAPTMGPDLKSSYASAETEQHLGHRSGEEAEYVEYWRSWWISHPELHATK